MNILDGSECLLPKLEFDRRIQLCEASVKVVLESFRVREVDRVGLMSILRYVCEVEAESLTKTSEFDFALVLQAESERLLRNLLQTQRKDHPPLFYT